MSNALGTVTPIKEIVAHRACARHSRCWSTAARARCICRSTCRTLDCDFFVFTGHKVYGPSGIGVLYGNRKDMLEEMRPFQGGGEMIFDVTEEIVTYNDPPHRFEAGTPPIVQAIGLGAALDYMETIGRERIAAHEAELKDYAHERLRAINSLRIFGDAPGKGAIISFELQGIHAHDVVDGDRPARRGGARRHALRPAAVETLRRNLHMQGIVRHVQYPRRGRRSGRGAGKGAQSFLGERPWIDAEQRLP